MKNNHIEDNLYKRDKFIAFSRGRAGAVKRDRVF